MTVRRHAILQAAGVGLFCLACMTIFVVLFGLAGGRIDLGEPYRVQAVVSTTVGLSPHSDVRQAGVKVGEVVGIAPRGGNAVLMLRLDDAHAPINRDARVRVRTKTLVGENYVDLDPGTPAAGRIASGGVLPIDRAEEAVQLDEILSTFDRPTRRRLQRLLTGLGGALDRHGDELNATFEASAAVVEESAPLARVLASERADVATLVRDSGRVMQALGDRRDALRTLARRARTTAEAVAGEEASLRGTLRELPATLRRARGTTGHLGAFSGRATPVIDQLGAAMNGLAPAMRILPRSARRTRRAMRELTPFSREARRLLAELRSFSQPAARAFPALGALLREFRPLVAHLAPYAPEAGAFFANLRSATNSYDATGNLMRVFAIVGPSAYTSYTPEMRAAFDALREAGAVGVSVRQGTNANPKPGSIARPRPFSGSFPRVEADRP